MILSWCIIIYAWDFQYFYFWFNVVFTKHLKTTNFYARGINVSLIMVSSCYNAFRWLGEIDINDWINYSSLKFGRQPLEDF